MQDRTIDAERLRRWLEEGRAVTVLDVRPTAEWDEWRIPGSLHVDAYEALKANDARSILALPLPRSTEIVTVCAAGQTSRVAAEALRARGYEALSLQGGMRAWTTAWNTASLPLGNGGAKVVQIRRTGKGCLSYLIGSSGEAALVDPSVASGVYERLAETEGWRIVSVVETHLHADHVSRARAVAARTGALLRMPARTAVEYPFEPIREGLAIRIGDAVLEPLGLPGHTMESMGFLVDERALLTGDTLFVNAIGRPDLGADAESIARRAALLHRSLHKLLALDPAVWVLPAHSSEPTPFDGRIHATTLGEIRHRVKVLEVSKDEFVRSIRSRLPLPPPNHEAIVGINRSTEIVGEEAVELETGANRCALN